MMFQLCPRMAHPVGTFDVCLARPEILSRLYRPSERSSTYDLTELSIIFYYFGLVRISPKIFKQNR